MLNYLTKSYEVRAYTFNGEFICVECGSRTSANSSGDRPQPVFNDQWNTEEFLESYGLEVFCASCNEEIRQPNRKTPPPQGEGAFLFTKD